MSAVENETNNESNSKENVPIEVRSISSDDVICVDGPSTNKKLKIESSSNTQNDSNICQNDATTNDVIDVMAPPNPNTPQYLDEQNNTTIMMMLNKQHDYMVHNSPNSNTNSNSNSTTNSCSSSPPPLSATISTVNSTCDSNLPYSIEIMGNEDNSRLREQRQQQQLQQIQSDPIYAHNTPENNVVQQHENQQQRMLITNSMQLDNCNEQILHNSYNNNNNLDEDEDDVIEQKFNDAENYVLESGEVSTDDSGNGKSNLWN